MKPHNMACTTFQLLHASKVVRIEGLLRVSGL